MMWWTILFQYSKKENSPLCYNTNVTLFLINVDLIINLITNFDEIYLLGQEVEEFQVLSQPIRRLCADFLCLASYIHAPCQLDWAEGHG